MDDCALFFNYLLQRSQVRQPTTDLSRSPNDTIQRRQIGGPWWPLLLNGCRMVGQNGHCFGKIRAGTPTEVRMYYDHRGKEDNSNESAGNVLGSAITGNGGGVGSTNGSIPSTEAKFEKLKKKA